jgi:GNAT superfamily N-acetyltransferase
MGRSGQPAVLFWHALSPPLNGLFFGEVAGVLATEHGCHVVAPDAPGFGGSPALPLDRRMLVDHVERRARREGCLELDLTSSHDRNGAHAFYRRLGFADVSRSFVKAISPADG